MAALIFQYTTDTENWRAVDVANGKLDEPLIPLS